MGVARGGGAKPIHAGGNVLQGQGPEAAAVPGQPEAVRHREEWQGQTAGGLIQAETSGFLVGAELRRVNPMSAAGAKKNRPGIEGRKSSRG